MEKPKKKVESGNGTKIEIEDKSFKSSFKIKKKKKDNEENIEY